MTVSAAPFLMFQGEAEEAMTFYVSLFDDGEVLDLVPYGRENPGLEGKVSRGVFTIGSLSVMCFDSPTPHAFGFTPAISLFIAFDDDGAFERVCDALLENGQALMPRDDYGFSRQFAWIQDKFGVSWQLNLE